MVKEPGHERFLDSRCENKAPLPENENYDLGARTQWTQYFLQFLQHKEILHRCQYGV